MSFENPLDKIKKINADNAAKKEVENAEILEQEKRERENIDTEYVLSIKEKEVYSQQIIDIKNRIAEISGTQEEMIAEYKKVIDEAKNDPKTLQYVRDHFQEIFSAGIKQWKNVGSDKSEVLSSLKDTEESALNAENKINKLYPKTTEGIEEIKKEEELKLLWSALDEGHEYVGKKTFESIREKLSAEEMKLYLTSKKELNLLKEEASNDLFTIRKHDNLIDYQVEKKEVFSEIERSLESLVSPEKPNFLKKEIPDLKKIKIKKLDIHPFEIELEGQGLFSDEIYEKRKQLTDYLSNLNQKIKKVKGSFFKKGLSDLEKSKINTQISLDELKVYFRNLVQLTEEMKKLAADSYCKVVDEAPNNLIHRIKSRDTSICELLDSVQEKPKDLTDEQKNLKEKVESLKETILQIEEKLK